MGTGTEKDGREQVQDKGALARAYVAGQERMRERAKAKAKEISNEAYCKPRCGYGACECDGHRAGAAASAAAITALPIEEQFE